MKFFVTGRSSNYDRVIAVYDEIEARGHEVTLKWTDFPMVKPYDKHVAEAAQFSEQQLTGIIEADVYIHFAHTDGNGVFAELGMAMAAERLQGNPVVCAIGDSEAKRAAMFHYHDSIRWFGSVDDVLNEFAT